MKLLRLALIAAALPVVGAAVSSSAYGQLHVGEYNPADIQRGAQLFATRCSTCHGNAGDQVAGVSLLSGRFRRASNDDELAAIIKGGIPGTAMPQGNYSQAELTRLVAYLRTAITQREGGTDTVSAGQPDNGRQLFNGKGQCITCHRVNGEGGWRGPNLSDIGAHRSAASLLQSMTDPSAEIIPLNQEIRAVTRDGRTIVGRRMNEDTDSIQLILEEQGRLVALMKSTLRDMVPVTQSPMPAYTSTLTQSELSDLVAYLRTLKWPD
jgi:putative heme-binding domain-containing protein